VLPDVIPKVYEGRLVIRYHPSAIDQADTICKVFNPPAEKQADETLPQDSVAMDLYCEDGRVLTFRPGGGGWS
jgi:hypothetical protein